MNYKVNAENWRAELSKALRSGEYKQGRSALAQPITDGYAYCCLGVLCEIAGEISTPSSSGYKNYGHSEHTSIIMLPIDLAKHLGIHTNGQFAKLIRIKGDDSYNSLVSCNDRGLTFEEIANLLDNPAVGFLKAGEVQAFNEYIDI